MTLDRQSHKKLADQLYEQYGKPLEAEHRGEYVAITPAGATVLAPTLYEALEQASTILGPENYVFKVGEKAVGRWRSTVRAL